MKSMLAKLFILMVWQHTAVDAAVLSNSLKRGAFEGNARKRFMKKVNSHWKNVTKLKLKSCFTFFYTMFIVARRCVCEEGAACYLRPSHPTTSWSTFYFHILNLSFFVLMKSFDWLKFVVRLWDHMRQTMLSSRHLPHWQRTFQLDKISFSNFFKIKFEFWCVTSFQAPKVDKK